MPNQELRRLGAIDKSKKGKERPKSMLSYFYYLENETDKQDKNVEEKGKNIFQKDLILQKLENLSEEGDQENSSSSRASMYSHIRLSPSTKKNVKKWSKKRDPASTHQPQFLTSSTYNLNGKANQIYEHVSYKSSPKKAENAIDQLTSQYDYSPSLCDSGYNTTDYLESLIREKEKEINILRQTMQKNELAIFQVHQEKEKMWKEKFNTLKSLLDVRFCKNDVYDKEEKNRTITKGDEVERHKNTHFLQMENKILKEKLENLNWKLCNKMGELSLVKAQMKALLNKRNFSSADLSVLSKPSLNDVNNNNEKSGIEDGNVSEGKNVRNNNKFLYNDYINIESNKNEDLQEMKDEKESFYPKSESSGKKEKKETKCSNKFIIPFRKRASTHLYPKIKNMLAYPLSSANNPNIHLLRSELDELKKEINDFADKFGKKAESHDKERKTWQDEKDKVISYQKQLLGQNLHLTHKLQLMEAENTYFISLFKQKRILT